METWTDRAYDAVIFGLLAVDFAGPDRAHKIETEREVLCNFAVNWEHVENMQIADARLDVIAAFLGIESKKG